MHRMFFRNVGGVHQLQVADEEDLARIDHVDPARWAATSAPTKDLICDPALLAHLDPAGTGRLRVKQLVAGRDWLFERLRNRARVRDRSTTLSLADVDDSHERGQKLRKAVEHVLTQAGKPDAGELTLAQLRDFRAGYAKTLLNGDGIVSPDHIPDPTVAAFAKDVIATVGSSKDASGLAGVGEPELVKFLERAKVFLEWRTKPTAAPAILVWGDETPAAADLVRALDAKVEEFFLHCDLVRQDALGAQPRLSPDEMRALKAKDTAALEAYLAGSPLAQPNPEGVLSLDGPINLIYADRFATLRAKVLGRLLGDEAHSLTRASWEKLKGTFDAYLAWQKEKPAEPFDKLDAKALEACVAGPLPEQLRAIIALDKAASGELEQLVEIEKFILIQRWILDIVNNFVNLSAIYHPSHDALMERGSLVIDGRRLDFCLKVDNREAHKKIASESLLFLVYATVTERDTPGGSTFEVVAPLTNGERGRLRAAKRGIFVDNDGKEWDAVIAEVVENPISLREAFKAPFRRIADFVNKKIEDLASSHLKMAETHAAEGAAPPAAAAPVAPVAAAAAAGGATGAAAGAGQGIQNMVLIGGLVATGLTAALGYVISILQNIHFFKTIFALGGLVLLIGGLSSFLGWLKLRRRDMSLILEANGWALNVPMKVTRRVGGLFAYHPRLPRGAKLQRIPVGGSARFWRIFAVVFLLFLVLVGYTVRWLRRDKGRNFDRVVDYTRDRYEDVSLRVHWVQKRIESIFSDVAPVESIGLPGAGILGYLAVDPGSRNLYVPHAAKIDVVDMDEDEKIGEIKVREAHEVIDARGITFAEIPRTLPDGTETPGGGMRLGFVTSAAAKKVVAFSLDTLRAEHEISTPNVPGAILAVPATSEVWCLNSGSITCLKLTELGNQQPKTIDTGARLRFAATLGDHVYATAVEKNKVAVVDAVTHTVVEWYDVPGGVAPNGIDVDHVRKLLFVSCKNKKLFAISAMTGKVVHEWEVGADASSVAYDAGKVFVACDGHVYFADVLDKSFGAMKPIETASAAKHLAVDPKTHKLYVTAPPPPPPPGTKGGPTGEGSLLVRNPWVGTASD
jgi:hypothetical protein